MQETITPFEYPAIPPVSVLAFTSSGTLTMDKPVNCEVCVVGGGGRYFEENGVERLYDGGSGYQGIVYMRIPVNQ